MKTERWLTPATLALLSALTCLLPGRIARAACADDPRFAPYEGTQCFNDFDHLLTQLRGSKNQTLRLVQTRNARPAPMPVHNQYGRACFYFSTATILEYLGYSSFQPLGDFNYDMAYVTRDGALHQFELNTGYRNSPEDMAALYTTFDSYANGLPAGTAGADIYGCGFFLSEPDAQDCPRPSQPRTALNTDTVGCNGRFQAAQAYGPCRTMGTFPEFLDRLGNGCDKDTACTCDPTAPCGMYYMMNKVLPELTKLAAANDARGFGASTAQDKKDIRRIVRAFVDANLPLLSTVNNGGHFMALVGYAELNADGLPRYAIAVDSVQLVLWKVDLDFWNQDLRFSPSSIIPWSQHTNGGCQAGGFALALDSAVQAKHRLCTMPSGVSPATVDPYYGIHLTCVRDRVNRAEYDLALDDPFAFEARNIDCDQVIVRYDDGANEVSYARARRYQKNEGTGRWTVLSDLAADDIRANPPQAGRRGPQNIVRFDAAWGEHHWLVAQSLTAPNTERRTTIELRLRNNATRFIEISPPHTYGIDLTCFDNDAAVAVYRTQGNRDRFRTASASPETVIWSEAANRSCDKLVVHARPGNGVSIARAEVERQFYGPARRWQKANATAPWAQDHRTVQGLGLTGEAYQLTWDDAWEDNLWLAAQGVGSGQDLGDRKTILRLFDAAGRVIRQLEIVPY